MSYVNVFWLYRYRVLPVLKEAGDVAIAHYPLLVVGARQQMLWDGFDQAAITFVEDQLRFELGLPSEP